MRNIIATWICIDEKKLSSHFPSAKGNSADVSVQKIYWRCVCTFFYTARYNNPDACLVLFSNNKQLPIVADIDISELLSKLDVHFYDTPFEFVTPLDYYCGWRNQFYEFSIFKFVSNHSDFHDEDNFLLLDSDCIIADNLSLVFKSIQKNGCITYVIDYDANQKINGISRRDMRFIFQELASKKILQFPAYHGGEFYASTIQMVKTMMADFYIVWPQLLKRNMMGLEKLNEEAHVLSYLFYKNGIDGGEANGFVKRLWTDPTNFRNVDINDAHLLVWHLPAEKRRGFKIFFYWLKSIGFDLTAVNRQTFQQRIQKTFLIPNIPMQNKPYYATKFLLKKIFG